MIFDILIRLGIAIIIGIVSIVFLNLSLIIFKHESFLKNNFIISLAFSILLFIFSFFPDMIFTSITSLVVLFMIKYLYKKFWRQSLYIWGAWMGFWLILIFFVSFMIWIIRPYSPLI